MIYCHKDNWENTKKSDVIGKNNNLGDWVYNECPKGYFIIGGSVKNQPDQGSLDDMAIYAISITCRHPVTNHVTQRTVADPNYYWNRLRSYDWIPDVVSPSKYVCGFSAQVDYTDHDYDGTGLNGVIYKMCEIN